MPTNYEKYRGKCKEFCDEAVQKDPSLTLVRGYYYCPIWNRKEQHWWTTRRDGSIFDPTAAQFPSNGLGDYEPFDGYFNCEQCGARVHEDDMTTYGHHVFCSGMCLCRCVGVY